MLIVPGAPENIINGPRYVKHNVACMAAIMLLLWPLILQTTCCYKGKIEDLAAEGDSCGQAVKASLIELVKNLEIYWQKIDSMN